ncbi:MAG: regulatory protein RecX [Patescibacteria group bacterium]|nr:recombination regulator RecX [Patescibacteria group bacterium]
MPSKQVQQSEEYSKLMEYSLKLLSKRRLTIHEMDLRLRKRNVGEEEDIVRVLERLQELDYLDDALYATDFIKDRMKFRPRGILLLKHDMYKKGLLKDVIEDAILSSDIDEEKIARVVAETRAGRLRSLPLFKRKQKLVFFLRSRGFAANTIYKVVDGIKE